MTRRAASGRDAQAGFTLLEVMVSMAILAISLSAVFSTEAGAIRMAARAQKMGAATLLARCKMGEIEEQVAKDGLPAAFDSGSDGCCTDAEIEGYGCDWEIEPILMPDTMFPSGEEGEEGAAQGATAAGGGNVDQAAMTTDPSQMLSGSADMTGMASMAMQFVYPVLKPAFEGQIRRATVTVKWREGSAERSFDVTQYLVADQPVIPGTQDAIEGAAPGTGTGTGTQPGTLPPGNPLGNLLGGAR